MSLLFRNRSVEKGASNRGRLPWWRAPLWYRYIMLNKQLPASVSCGVTLSRR